jgi:uncharacterized protein YegP (UPF0339 family)
MGYFKHFQGTNRQWYWQLCDGNHQIIAVGGEGYISEANVLRAIENVKHSMPR